MITNRRGSLRAKQLLNDIGFNEITDFPMNLLVSGLRGTLIEEPLKNSDGKIIRGRTKTLIKVNSEIHYEAKKRFTIAHEIGHLLMHDKMDIHSENSNTLNWFNSAENQLRKGTQEWEANDFAAELLMPEKIFYKEANGNKFSPELIKYLSNRFKTSITSTVYRYLQLNLHPIFIASIYNGIVKYWSKSSSLWVRIKDINKLSPPSDSVATEYIDADYDFIYTGKDKAQPIDKSTWFELKENENDSNFFEYCIPTKQYKTVISVVWED
jgi:Zn-dependent peptidase ImmA (M78 family)